MDRSSHCGSLALSSSQHAADLAGLRKQSWYSSTEALSTVFFPRRLPTFLEDQSKDPLQFATTGALSAFAEVAGGLLPPAILEMVQRWDKSYRLEIGMLNQCCSELHVGDTLPVYLAAQNSALTLTRTAGGMVTVRAFEVQQSLQAVTASEGPLRVTVPHSSVCVPAEFIFSPTFLRQLVALQNCTFDDAMGRTQDRHGSSLQEERDCASPKYVLQWMMSVFSAVGAEDKQTMSVRKKVRDAACFTQVQHRGKLPWRRHPAWFAFKSVLVSSLIDSMGSVVAGTVLYKAALLQFMLPFVQVSTHEDSHDIMCQMLAKISQRIQKLSELISQLPENQKDLPQTSMQLIRKLLNRSADVVQEVSGKQCTLWGLKSTRFDEGTLRGRMASIPGIPPVTSEDVELSLPISRRKLQELREQHPVKPRGSSCIKPRHANRSSMAVLGQGGSSYTDSQQLSGIHDFEEMILDMWEERWNLRVKGRDLQEYLCNYINATQCVVKCHDPLGNSRRLLVGAVITVLCDIKTLLAYPWLKDHASDIDVQPLKEILAPDSRSLRVIAELEDYVSTRKRHHPGPLETNISSHSISVCYARQDKLMCQKLDTMMEENAAAKERHLRIVQRAIESFQREEQALNSMDCEYRFWSKSARCWRDWHSNVHCTKCLGEQELRRRTQTVFEEKLPSSADERFAAIFEANLPEEIGAWRDTIYFYHKDILMSLDNGHKEKVLWRDDLGAAGYSSTVALGSTSMRLARIHLGTAKLHGSYTSDFFKECHLNCVLMANGVGVTTPGNTQSRHQTDCSWKLQNPSLQDFLPGCTKQQSEVLARQDECPHEFNKTEFLAFGSLRAGERLQWFNILRGIHQRTLLLNRPEVAQLLCRAVWQAGETSDAGDHLRQAHQPCANDDFVLDMTNELQAALAGIQNNWQHYWTLLAVIMLANRLFDINSHGCTGNSSNCAMLKSTLQICRSIAIKWLKDIQMLVEKEIDRSVVKELRSILANIATFGALTFCHTAELIKEGRAIYHWMRFITVIRNNASLAEPSVDEGEGFANYMRRMVIRVTIDRHVDLVGLLKHRSVEGRVLNAQAELTAYMKEFYSPGECEGYQVSSNDQLWVAVKWCTGPGTTHNVEVDLREGQFYVDGYPQTHLPEVVTSHSLYKRHFGSAVFSVSPTTGPRNERAQITQEQGSGCYFVFGMIKALSGPVSVNIYEVAGSGPDRKSLLLLSLDWFQEKKQASMQCDLPRTLLEGHSHWLDVLPGKVYFRDVSASSSSFDHYEKAAFILDLDSGQLVAQETAPAGIPQGSILLSQNRPLASALLKILSGLELPEYTEIWRVANKSTLVRLPRLGLSFELSDGETILYSVDHKGWHVDSSQSVGSLLGLSSGLVLARNKSNLASTEDKDENCLQQRCLLVPHGKILTRSADSSLSAIHHNTYIEMAEPEFLQPPFFRYDLNKDLHQLTGTSDLTAWLYLAALHAHTSSVFVDSFTGLTGMESAMNILQSSRCWSSLPLEKTSKSLLQQIAGLSPKRSFYPSTSQRFMEVVNWPHDLLHSLCASDAYSILARRIRRHHKQLQFLHQPGGVASRSRGFANITRDDDQGASDDDSEDEDVTVRRASVRLKAKSAGRSLAKKSKSDASSVLIDKAYCRCAGFYPLLARLQKRHFPSVDCQTMCQELSLSVKTIGTIVAVLKQKVKPPVASWQDLESKLLGNCKSKGYDDDNDEEMAFFTTPTQEQLETCTFWPQLSLPRSFFLLHRYVNDKRSHHTFHLSLLLSFLIFRLEGQPLEMSSEMCLVEMLTALAATRTVVKPPACQSFPQEKATIPEASFFLDQFFPTQERYLLRRGIREASLFDVYSSLEEEAMERKKEQALEQYRREKLATKEAVQKDIQVARQIQALPPSGYEDEEPEAASISHAIIFFSSFQTASYRETFKNVLDRANRSNILSSYAQQIISASQALRHSGILLPLNVRHECKVLLPQHHDTVEYVCTANFRLHALRQLWSSAQATADLRAEDTVAESEDEILDAPLPLLCTSLSKQSSSDPIVRDFAEDLETSMKALRSQAVSIIKPSIQHATEMPSIERYLHHKAVTAQGWKFLEESMQQSCSARPGTRALQACGLLSRCHPLTVLPLLVQAKSIVGATSVSLVEEHFSSIMLSFIGGVAVSQVITQRQLRMLRHEREEQLDLLIKEALNMPHVGWQPAEHPEWLLFEVENDLCIRSQQVDVALQMMSPSAGKHSVMQLNMGEGKTSVILPIVAAELADGEALVRLIVLTSLHNTNCTQLIFKLGGLLNRRVLSLPFRRDIHLTLKQLTKIDAALKTCKQEFGAMVTVREHVLSLQLKFFESCHVENMDNAKQLAEEFEFFHASARDIIDEADEVLHHRFQLVYPVGHHRPPDGDETRWHTCQMVLECVKACAQELSETFDELTVDFSHNKVQEFPHLRIFNTSARDKANSWLCSKVASAVLTGKGRTGTSMSSELMEEISELSPGVRGWLKEFVLKKTLDDSDVDKFKGEVPHVIQKHILCLRGILAHDILLLGLQKRYRVEYGLVATTNQANVSGQRKIRMAVPFRAKDVAAERTEFGHSDVAIMLTHLSYYQHGLEESQIDQVFDKLERKDHLSRNAIYESWVAAAENVHRSARHLEGVNRKDKGLMKEFVYTFLRRHVLVINFFLNHFIFVSEAKEFPWKLVGNAWSLTAGSRKKLVTGFSGTNDTRHLLPESIAQRDLPELRHTNAHVCGLVLDEENDVYVELPPLCAGRKLLECVQMGRCKFAAEGVDVQPHTLNTIIDVGALVLDLTNEQVAQNWLVLRPDKQAAVYFDESDQLTVFDRQTRRPCKLALSPYSQDLSECLVYLDHSHTRGTDLRMAPGTRAVVTLGKGLRRDELVQACMRMRRLGSGHTLSFWAPAEVNTLIRERCRLKRCRIHHLDVLQWCFWNSIDATKDGFLSWASQGLAFLETEKALSKTSEKHSTLCSSSAVKFLGAECVLDDCMPLEEMYCRPRREQSIASIVQGRSSHLPEARQLAEACRHFVPGEKRYAQVLDEEQERELEQENEEEKQPERLGKSEFITEECPKYLIRLVKTGNVRILYDPTCDSLPLWQCLKNTSLMEQNKAIINSRAWNCSRLQATQSFASTVKPQAKLQIHSMSTRANPAVSSQAASRGGDWVDHEDDEVLRWQRRQRSAKQLVVSRRTT